MENKYNKGVAPIIIIVLLGLILGGTFIYNKSGTKENANSTKTSSIKTYGDESIVFSFDQDAWKQKYEKCLGTCTRNWGDYFKDSEQQIININANVNEKFDISLPNDNPDTENGGGSWSLMEIDAVDYREYLTNSFNTSAQGKSKMKWAKTPCCSYARENNNSLDTFHIQTKNAGEEYIVASYQVRDGNGWKTTKRAIFKVTIN